MNQNQIILCNYTVIKVLNMDKTKEVQKKIIPPSNIKEDKKDSKKSSKQAEEVAAPKQSWVFLRKNHLEEFRLAPTSQGLWESLLIIVFHFLYASYNDKWFYFLDQLVVFIILLTSYFETSLISINPKTGPNILKASYLFVFFYFVREIRLAHYIHYLVLLFGASTIR